MKEELEVNGRIITFTSYFNTDGISVYLDEHLDRETLQEFRRLLKQKRDVSNITNGNPKKK